MWMFFKRFAHCWAILAVFSIAVNDAWTQPRRSKSFGSAYKLYANAYMGSDNKSYVKVRAIVRYGNVVFLKKKDLFEASYDLYLKVLDSEGEMIESAVLRDRIVVDSYDETHSRKKSSKVAQTFQLDPGEYVIEAVLAIQNTHLKIPKTLTVTVPNFLSKGVGLSIPVLYAVPSNKVPSTSTLFGEDFLEGEDIKELEHTSFLSFDAQPAIGFEIYLESKSNSSIPCELSYEVVDIKKHQFLYGKRTIRLSGSGDPFVVSFDVDEWEPGAYQFNVRAVLEKPQREATSSLRFTIEFNRAMLGKYFQQTIEILSLIASREELSDIENAPYERRTEAWAEFWKRRDPTPQTEVNEALEEHLRRVRYVSLHFSSLGAGWKTDRGKVYIKYGEPDQIDSTTDPYLQGHYQIWRYYSSGLVFIFYDRFGLEDYRLIRTDTF